MDPSGVHMIRDWLTPDKINVINSIDNWKMPFDFSRTLAGAGVYGRALY
jgi:hypothetical protein